MGRAVTRLLVVCCLTAAAPTMALATHTDTQPSQPQGGSRSHLENYKDMLLAICITDAYPDDAEIAKDAGSSVSALDGWTVYDLDHASAAFRSLVRGYLRRDYSVWLKAHGLPSGRYGVLKCLDMYHSQALELQARRMVIEPQVREASLSP